MVTLLSQKDLLLENIASKNARSGVVGLGDIGLPLAVEMANSGFKVTGIETDPVKVETIQSGRSYIDLISSSDISKLIAAGRFFVTTSFKEVGIFDTIHICIPTPLRKTGAPDLSMIMNVLDEMLPRIRQGQLIILESATYPGTLDEIFSSLFRKAGFEIGKDIFLAYSPERDDSGYPRSKIKNIPRVVGGFTPDCTEVAIKFYKELCSAVIPVSSLKVAEMVNLLEKSFQNVNLALMNEMTLLCHKMGIDIWEVIDAAKTRPSRLMSFYPGPGTGGTASPIDPAYLSWKAKVSGFETRFIDLSHKINASMPEFVVTRITQLLNESQKSLSGSKILIVGVTCKKDVADIRESPALDVARLLLEKGVDLMFYDPFVQQMNLDGIYFQRIGLGSENLRNCDLVVILTDHAGVNYGRIVKYARLVFDTRNAARRFKAPHLVRL